MRYIARKMQDQPYKTTASYFTIILLLAVIVMASIWYMTYGRYSTRSTTLPAYNPTSQTTGKPTATGLTSLTNNSVTTDTIAEHTITYNDMSLAFLNWHQDVSVGLRSQNSALEVLKNIPPVDISGLLSEVPIAGVAIDNLADDVIDLLNDASAGTILDGSITGLKLATQTIDASHLVDDIITSDLIQDGVIATTDIATGAITGLLINDGSVGTSDIASSAITSTSIADSTIAGGDLANSIISDLHIIDGTISTLDIASGAITSGLVATGAITSTAIANATIDTIDIANNAITNGLIANDAVTGGKILDGTVNTLDIAGGAITNTLLNDSAVTSAKINDGAISSDDIATGAITNGLLAANAATTDKLSTAANKRVSFVQIGDIASLLSSVTERPIFVAPTNGTITKVTFTDAGGITAALNKGTISLLRKTAPTATVGSVSLASISLGSFTPYLPTLGSGTSFSTGDVYSFRYSQGLLGAALTGFLVTIEYTASE